MPVQPKEIESILLTHAPIDHRGYIPLMIKNGFKRGVNHIKDSVKGVPNARNITFFYYLTINRVAYWH